MGLIGRWVDEMVRHEPELMQVVHDRPWGNVAEWTDSNCERGCLVGTCIIVLAEREAFKHLIQSGPFPSYQGFSGPMRLVMRRANRAEFMDALRGFTVPNWVADRADSVGQKVASMMWTSKVRREWLSGVTVFPGTSCHRTSAQVEALVKARIARRLAETVPVEPSPLTATV